MRTKPALPCSHTSLKTHQSTGIRRAEIQNREKEEARTKPSKAKPSPKSRRPQVTSSPRYLAPAQTTLLSMMTMHGGSNGGDDGNVSRREMSFPVSVVGAIDIVIGAVGAIDIGAIGAVGAALTLPSFLLVIAALFLSSITSHPLPQSQPFLPHPSSSPPHPPFMQVLLLLVNST